MSERRAGDPRREHGISSTRTRALPSWRASTARSSSRSRRRWRVQIFSVRRAAW